MQLYGTNGSYKWLWSSKEHSCISQVPARAYSHTFPANDFSLDTTMQGLKRRLARTPFFVMPLTPRILTTLYPLLDMSKPQDLALWTSFLTAFYGLFRKANVVPESDQFNPSQTLTRGHITLDRSSKIVYVQNWDSIIPPWMVRLIAYDIELRCVIGKKCSIDQK